MGATWRPYSDGMPGMQKHHMADGTRTMKLYEISILLFSASITLYDIIETLKLIY